MSIRTSADDKAGVYAMLEVLAELRNGVRMHIHNNEYGHFLFLKGTLHIANGGEGLDVLASAAGSVKKGVLRLGVVSRTHLFGMLIILWPGHIVNVQASGFAR